MNILVLGVWKWGSWSRKHCISDRTYGCAWDRVRKRTEVRRFFFFLIPNK